MQQVTQQSWVSAGNLLERMHHSRAIKNIDDSMEEVKITGVGKKLTPTFINEFEAFSA